MEPDQWDKDPEQVAVEDFARRERAPHRMVLILPMEEILTGDFSLGVTPTEEISMEGIPMG
jgi:hypothetical protein